MAQFLRYLVSQLGPPTILAIQSVSAAHLFWKHGLDLRFTSGASMLPTLEADGDAVLISNLHRHGRGVSVGDVVAFKIPVNDHDGIKRVIGLPGDFVMVDTPESGSETMVQVPPGHCWVVGDNMLASRDSRLYGPIPLAMVRGKVLARVWPFSESKWLRNPLKRPENH
ncbi:putative mitochondrial inner membrane protease subunit 1 [Thozetella sp. PMI_491]|nr:putative mitochondrial inner membrane protease subunit 1 [Thozetella sp. PMI_491]